MDTRGVIALLYQLADDELVVGHRDSEWLGLAPHIEEDVAFSSIAQDEVGHAALYYRLLEELGEGRADDLAFLRPAGQRRNAVLLERPNGPGTYLAEPRFDWGYTIVRRLAYDLFDAIRLEVLCSPRPMPRWPRRRPRSCGRSGTTCFTTPPGSGGWPPAPRNRAGGWRPAWPRCGPTWAASSPWGRWRRGRTSRPARRNWSDRWTAELAPLFAEVGLTWPGRPAPAAAPGADGRLGQHTPELDGLLETMGEVYRTAPGAAW